jgi:tRNA(adenine34) deaminase
MCAGAILNGRVTKVVYGSRDKRLGALGSAYDILNGNPLNREIEVVGGVLGEECLDLLRSFFQDLRKRPSKSAEIEE